ncbi:hypothetical protein V6N12_010469 [Hibiscus sabdariffa]|uniref:Uncharacterized protein n=1 Tax=Hibiscus sabdariffa TaxID=183260 RepID=A0ABR2EKI4_9ROSI
MGEVGQDLSPLGLMGYHDLHPPRLVRLPRQISSTTGCNGVKLLVSGTLSDLSIAWKSSPLSSIQRLGYLPDLVFQIFECSFLVLHSH